VSRCAYSLSFVRVSSRRIRWFGYMMHMGEIDSCKSLVRKPRCWSHLVDLGVDGIIMKMWNALSWLRASGGFI
jgi:hypothetical protein